MGFAKNILITFVFTIFFVVSNVHCYPGIYYFEVKQDYKKCYLPCKQIAEGSEGCERFCAAMSFQLVGKCISDICCCRYKKAK
ncbi:hypothetical protein DY000_02010108 [Brassica cretica]|uniref:Knottin scorpion toxin-like domain-containing protein n=1 Tax=Brassica cretica TaxID=69181 RepID=A0ABQ7CLS9_BRACR|nr:hypothetical protein DY000_02010108 [Brassica cretica]